MASSGRVWPSWALGGQLLGLLYVPTAASSRPCAPRISLTYCPGRERCPFSLCSSPIAARLPPRRSGASHQRNLDAQAIGRRFWLTRGSLLSYLVARRGQSRLGEA